MNSRRKSSQDTSSTSSVFLPPDELMDKVRKCVGERGIMEIFKELLTDEEVEEIQKRYRVHDSPDCYNWPKFLHDAETETSAQFDNKTSHTQKEEVLKRVAQLMQGKNGYLQYAGSSSQQGFN
ncbi:hypothetical protein OS493_037831 [Desmophyllum pertusum]|uniref:Uncharacterized protein n=1 Tax=Desmophyllum pertusum TaxID=174260 RepID=A0A9W9YU98_9CNID|nr:hypothetical protein OS493_037831 [Desmophyllum pertusum]